MNGQYPLKEEDGTLEIDIRQMEQERKYKITLSDETYYYQLIGETLYVYKEEQ